MIHHQTRLFLTVLLTVLGMQQMMAQGYLCKANFEDNTYKTSDKENNIHDVTINGDTAYVAVTFTTTAEGYWVKSDTYVETLGTNQTAELVVEDLQVYKGKFNEVEIGIDETINLPVNVGFYDDHSHSGTERYQIATGFQPSTIETNSNGRVQFQTSSSYKGDTITIVMKVKLVYTHDESLDPDPEEPEDPNVLNIENAYVRDYCSKANSTFSSAASNYSESFFTAAAANYADQPASRTIEFESETATTAQVVLSQQSDYSAPELTAEVTLTEGKGSFKLTNLYPDKTYYCKVVAGEEVLATDEFTTTGQIRMIALENGFNIRDLGGWKGLGGKIVKYGQIYRGASLGGSDKDGNTSDLTEADKAEMKRLGVRAQLDLRAATNEGKYTNEGSLHSYSRGETTLTDACFANIMTDYGAYNQDASIVHDMAFIIYELKQGHPVYFNCRQGADRTGIIAFVIEGLLGCNEYSNEAGGNQMALDYELTGFSGANRVDNWKVSSSYRGAQSAYNTTAKLFHQLIDLNPSGVELSSLQERCYYYLNRYFTDGCNSNVQGEVQVGIDKDDLDWFIRFMLDLPEYTSPTWAVDAADLKTIAEKDANVVQHKQTIVLRRSDGGDDLNYYTSVYFSEPLQLPASVEAYGVKDFHVSKGYLQQLVSAGGMLPALTPAILVQMNTEEEANLELFYTLNCLSSSDEAIPTGLEGYLESTIAAEGTYMLQKKEGQVAFYKADGASIDAHTATYAPATTLNPGKITLSFVDFLLGDVNNDGFVTIADVTRLVNIILGSETLAEADINSDGQVSIADVTALVNIILGKNPELS